MLIITYKSQKTNIIYIKLYKPNYSNIYKNFLKYYHPISLRTSVLFLCRQPISLMAGLHPVRIHRQIVS